MPIPDFQSLLLPLLRFSADGLAHSMAEAREAEGLRLGVLSRREPQECGAMTSPLDTLNTGYGGGAQVSTSPRK